MSQPSRVVEGIRLISSGGGHWESADGKYGVQLETGVTFCDEEHPMKLTPAMIKTARENPNYADNHLVIAALTCGKRGYLCPGMAEHGYPIWTVWSANSHFDLDMGDTFGAALGILAVAIRRERATT